MIVEGLLGRIVIGGLVGLAFGAIKGVIRYFFTSHFGQQVAMPETLQAELSETDREKVEETQNLIRAQFGEDVYATVRSMSKKERLEAANRFAEDLAKLYGLDIEIDIDLDRVEACGYCNWSERKAVFNIVELMVDNDHPNFEMHIKNFFDTIIHELRHGVQYMAVENPGFWDVSEERRQAWEDNFQPGHYIRPDVDLRSYSLQPVEHDASTFAATVMEGVFAQ